MRGGGQQARLKITVNFLRFTKLSYKLKINLCLDIGASIYLRLNFKSRKREMVAWRLEGQNGFMSGPFKKDIKLEKLFFLLFFDFLYTSFMRVSLLSFSVSSIEYISK